MLPEMGAKPVIGGGGGGGEVELSLYRSGSAPPTVEGSLAAVGGLFGGSAPGFENGNGFVSEEELRSDPAYLSYYYSHVKLNPRLPPPVVSKEDWRLAQRLRAGGSASKTEEGCSRSLFLKPPGFGLEKRESEVEPREAPGLQGWVDKGGDGLIGLSGMLGRQKSFAEILQDDLGHMAPVTIHSSHSASRNSLNNGTAQIVSSEGPLGLHNEVGSLHGLLSGGNIQHVPGVHNSVASAAQTFSSVLDPSLSRSNTPDPHLVARTPSPCLPPVGTRRGAADKRTGNGSSSFNVVSSGILESDDLVAALAGLDLSSAGEIDEHNIALSKFQQESGGHHNYVFDSEHGQTLTKPHVFLKKSEQGHLDISSIQNSVKNSYSHHVKGIRDLVDLSNTSLRHDAHFDPISQRSSHSSPNLFLKAASVPSFGSPGGSTAFLNGDDGNGAFTSFGPCPYSFDPALTSMIANQIGTGNLPPLFENAVAASGMASPMSARGVGNFNSGPNFKGGPGSPNHNSTGGNTAAASLLMPHLDPLSMQYLRNREYAALATANFTDAPMDRSNPGNSYVNLFGIQNAYLQSMVQQQKQFDVLNLPILGKSGSFNHGYFGNPAFGLGMSYPGSPLASPILPAAPVGPGSLLQHGERNLRFPSGLRNFAGGVMDSWHSDISGHVDCSLASSLLEEFKNNKTKCYELSDIAGHVVEFSADQFGSRFIQQKLETATTAEKDMVFEEIMPQALTLMTDVFGNYVIQKFFDHGTPAQIREMAGHLIGHVLTLGLQMYGCRVIQKAIEVVDLDQKIKMVIELDGHVMRCVRDQNGNHVIQKCIECIPQDAIQFIITSFYGQVVMLSTHPYGCRVIQRVLEHCDDPETQQIVMDEVMQCICMLAQDQYGNYVVQHILEHGKPHERSAIIEKLAGQIIQMSQQKFASNVVEKCLTFGDPFERQILVTEMLGSTDENEPLQAMMKDQFGNYVVQKVLETCDDQQREMILSRIKVHLNALKKYTYGKHIVARVEKLVAAGERRIGLQSSYTS